VQLQTNNKVCQIELFGRRLLLSERTARDVNKLVEFAKTSSVEHIDLVLQNLVVVTDGLKINIEQLKWWQLWKRLTLKRLLGGQYIHSKLSVNAIISLANKVLELEGIDLKKKSRPEQK